MGFREAYAGARPVILEPIMRSKSRPRGVSGLRRRPLNQRPRRHPEHRDRRGLLVAVAHVPLNTMFGYSRISARPPRARASLDGVAKVPAWSRCSRKR